VAEKEEKQEGEKEESVDEQAALVHNRRASTFLSLGINPLGLASCSGQQVQLVILLVSTQIPTASCLR